MSVRHVESISFIFDLICATPYLSSRLKKKPSKQANEQSAHSLAPSFSKKNEKTHKKQGPGGRGLGVGGLGGRVVGGRVVPGKRERSGGRVAGGRVVPGKWVWSGGGGPGGTWF